MVGAKNFVESKTNLNSSSSEVSIVVSPPLFPSLFFFCYAKSNVEEESNEWIKSFCIRKNV